MQITADPDGGFIVTSRGLPEGVTQGATPAQATAEAEGALQAALDLTLREQGLGRTDLAKRLRVDEQETRRTLNDPDQGQSPASEAAMHCLGTRLDHRLATD